MIVDVLEARTNYAPTDDYWYNPSAPEVAAGVAVSEDTALNFINVYQCVNLLSKTLASLPCIMYERLERGKDKAVDHSYFRLLRYQPNPEITAFRYIQTKLAHVLTWGNGYSQKTFSKSGQITGLWLLRPDRMEVKREKGRLIYEYSQDDGQKKIFQAREIFHIPGFGFDGLVGKSQIGMAREAIGLGIATEMYGAKFFGNGSMPGGVLVHPNKLKKEDKIALREAWEGLHKGPKNSHNVAVLEQGLEWKQIGIPPDDAQFLETRKFQKGEIASFYGIPLHLVGLLDRATFSNVEHQSLEFVQYTMQPWITLWEQELQRSILQGSSEYFFEFLVSNLLRGDAATRSEYYRTMVGVGAFSINDVREKENMNPVDGGDTHFVPLNTVPLDAAIKMGAQLESDDDGMEQEEDSLRFARRAVEERRKISAVYRSKFEDLAGRIVRSEVREVAKLVNKHLGQRDSLLFTEAIQQFYMDHRSWIVETITPLWLTYSEEIKRAALGEIGVAEEVVTLNFQQFVRQFINTYALRHTTDSQAQLLALARGGQGEDVAAVINQRLKEWNEKRAKKMAQRDATEGNAAFAVAVFIAAGRIRKVWVTTGAETCPFCMALDGKTIEIQRAFLNKGDSLFPEGAKAPFKPKGKRKYPPLHGGCDCGIAAAI